MKLKVIIKDILDDIGQVFQEVFRFDMEVMKGSHLGRVKDMGSLALLIYLLPNLFGFAIGMAFAKMCELSGYWYIGLGSIGSVVVGAMHGQLSGTVTFKAGLIRNTIVTVAAALIIFIYMKIATL